MTERRWSKFWWQDWQRDPAVRMCSPAARGVWMDMLCIAADAVPKGHLLVNGKQPNNRQLSSVFGISERETAKLLAELESAGVFSRTEDGTIYSRRMVRDAGASEGGAEQVGKRWGLAAEPKSRGQRLSAARKKGQHTPEEWSRMLDATRHKCVRCGASEEEVGGLVRDHITPVYQGGSDGIDNIQPLCRKCNASKGPDTTDHRPKGWEKRLGERLGQSPKTPTLEAEAEAEAETPYSPPPNLAARYARCLSVSKTFFDQFWQAYPRKENKPRARKAYAIAEKKASPTTILRALERTVWPTDRRFIPHPASWLNGERWLDEAPKRRDLAAEMRAALGLDEAEDRPMGMLQ